MQAKMRSKTKPIKGSVSRAMLPRGSIAMTKSVRRREKLAGPPQTPDDDQPQAADDDQPQAIARSVDDDNDAADSDRAIEQKRHWSDKESARRTKAAKERARGDPRRLFLDRKYSRRMARRFRPGSSPASTADRPRKAMRDRSQKAKRRQPQAAKSPSPRSPSPRSHSPQSQSSQPQTEIEF